MIVILRAHGLRIVIFTDDHPPPHVHVIGDGQAKIRLAEVGGKPEVLEATGMKASSLKKALQAVTDHQEMLMERWRQIHG
ncbi:MAG: hypothetical protein BGO82_01065 [Devosia sp. 67-54]|uniref:DUF4160 domain-containing protein n=1 Tax=unclassified Devosia TaxID=196773 RepID=UPI00095CDF1A|nr:MULTISPECIES: DUF4160 domain-containing protein [unclassified Devosia]MBN9305946.1 DUF4160 domain-containing protein [Devosia sp.]OJX16366.1 MAG: hypothetical protein BGO82_01065 [Devosia sp. 67-54]